MLAGLHVVLDDHARASEEALADLSRQKTRDADIRIELVGDYAKQARAEVDLTGDGAVRTSSDLIALATDLADSRSVDGWGVGLFMIQRYIAEAQRAGRTALASDLATVLRRIDPGYTQPTR